MAGFVYPNAEKIVFATGIKTPFATGLLKLIKAPVDLTPDIELADLTPSEADFTGYTAITLVSLPPVFIDRVNGGVSFEIPTVQWDVDPTPTVFNDIYGGWIESAAGALLFVWGINTAWPMQQIGDSLPLSMLFNFFGSGQALIRIAGQAV